MTIQQAVPEEAKAPAMVEEEILLDIEGKVINWDRKSVTTEEIIVLGGWDATHGVILVDVENNERVLGPGEEVEIKVGISFGKRIRWKRG